MDDVQVKEISIELDRPDGRYNIGDQITGVVRISMRRSCPCRRVAIEWWCAEIGPFHDGPRQGQVSSSVLVKGVQIPFEGALELPFSFEAPAGPLSYLGEQIILSWRLRASADVVWAELAEEVEFTVVSTDPVQDYNYGPRRPSVGKSKWDLANPTPQLLFGIGYIIGGALILKYCQGWIGRHPIWATVVLMLLMLGGLWTACKSLFFMWKMSRAIGRFQIDFGKSEYHRGEMLTCTLKLIDRAPTQIKQKFIATLVGQERYMDNTDFENRRERCTSFHHECVNFSLVTRRTATEMTGDGPYRSTALPVTTCELQAQLPIPQDVPCSYYAKGLAVEWLVQISLPNIEWTETCPVLVRP